MREELALVLDTHQGFSGIHRMGAQISPSKLKKTEIMLSVYPTTVGYNWKSIAEGNVGFLQTCGN